MARAFSFIMVLMAISISSASAISITEVELNPAGPDSGNEWVELYSLEEVSLSGYYLENADGQIHNLTGTFTGYFIIRFESQWLDNSNETVFLKDSNAVLSSTPVLGDSKNDALAWNDCGEWVMVEATMSAENLCVEKDIGENIPEEEEQPDEREEPEMEKPEEANGTASGSISQEVKKQKIVLSYNKTEPEYFETREYDFRLWLAYGFSFLCLLIIIFLALRKA